MSAPGDARCRLCFADLSEAPAAIPRAAETPRASRFGRLGRIGLGFAAVLVAVVAFVVYQATLGRPSLPEDPAISAAPAVARNDRTTEVTPRLDAPVAWRVPLPGELSAAPVMDAERVYVPLKDARLVALSRADGREVWSIAVPGQVNHSPVIAGDALFWGQRDGRAVSVEAATGTTRWSTQLADWVEARPVVLDGAMFVVAGPELAALDARTGEVLWSQDAHKGAVPPLAATGRGIAAATRERFLVFDRDTGGQTYVLDALAVAGVAAHRGTTFTLTARTLVAVDEQAERPWWEPLRTLWWTLYVAGMAPAVPLPEHRWVVFNTQVPPAERFQGIAWPDPHPLTFDEERVFISFPRGEMRAHALADGALRWKRNVGPIDSAPIRTPAGLLYASGRSLVLLDPATGEEVARHQVAPDALTQVVVEPGGLLLVSARELILLRQ
ncbi:MAG: PQQ-binding-like beta-propeller repeat protein [Dehalococcoidia bacterium]